MNIKKGEKESILRFLDLLLILKSQSQSQGNAFETSQPLKHSQNSSASQYSHGWCLSFWGFSFVNAIAAFLHSSKRIGKESHKADTPWRRMATKAK